MAVKERPILFNSEMVNAILEGRKTQTRRMLEPQPDTVQNGVIGPLNGDGNLLMCKYGKVGDRLWVRETWAVSRVLDFHAPRHLPEDTQVYYLADGLESFYHRHAKTRVSIHMPRWASRIQLEITNVRIERLQNITEEDAKAEGYKRVDDLDVHYESHRCYFSVLWDSIYGKDKDKSWNANPWVWVIQFKRVII